MKNTLTDTYTPMEIDGKIVVVVNAPDAPTPLDIHFERKKRIYYSRLSTCTKYPTLEEDREYWQGKLGVKMDRSEFVVDIEHAAPKNQYDNPTLGIDTICIPEQSFSDMVQKQEDEDLLEDLVKILLPEIGTFPNTLTVGMATDCAKAILKHYQLRKRK